MFWLHGRRDMSKKVGRNELCNCGSGRKAKNCCGVAHQKHSSGAGLMTSGWTIGVFAVVCTMIIGGIWYSTQSVTDPRLTPPSFPSSNAGTTGEMVQGGNSGLPVKSILEQTSYNEIPGIDLSVLSEDDRKKVMQRTNVEKCSCGCGFTIAGCRHLDISCGVSLPMARQIVTEVSGS